MKLENKDLPRGTIIPVTVATAACSLQARQVFRSETGWGRSVIEWPRSEERRVGKECRL